MAGTLKIGGKTLATHNSNTNVAKIQLGSADDVVLADSAGNNVLSESGGTVTLGNTTLASSVINDNYGFAQVKLTGDVGTQGFITFNTIIGDSNFTISSELITLPYSGIYHIVFSGTGYISGNTPERTFSIGLYTGGGSLLAIARDQIDYLDSAGSFGNACLSYVGSFSASDTIKFHFTSDSGSSVVLRGTSHASLVLVRRTA